MKKVILGAAALMIGGMAFGQEAFTLSTQGTQSGTTAQIAPNLSSNANANAVDIDQAGNTNKVRVAQAGTIQSAFVRQGDGDGTGGNITDIVQSGDVYPDSGYENVADVSQLGTANGVVVDQEGDHNLSVVAQGADDAASSGNTAIIQQGIAEQGQQNTAETYQDGVMNFSRVTQIYDRNTSWVDQTGTENKSSITQNAREDYSEGQLAKNVQNGENNESTINQAPADALVGDSARSEAYAYQNGDNNVSLQTQKSTALEGGSGETATISQGDASVAIGATFLYANSSSSGDMVQDLEDLDADLTITGGTSNNAIAIQEQGGEDNAAEIHQYGSGSQTPSNYAKQVQGAGSQSNQALIVQNNNGNANGDGSFAFQDQSGFANDAALAQNGFRHAAQQVQDGDFNIATSVQRGSDNSLFTTQTGDNNYVQTKQFGMDNIALVSQNGGHSATIVQNGGEYGVGGNQASVFQTGPGGGALTPNPALESHDFGARDAVNAISTTSVTIPTLTVTGGF